MKDTKMKVHLEVRPRLKVVNVIVESSLLDEKVAVTADDSLLQINEDKFVLTKISLEKKELLLENKPGSGLVFRLEIKAGVGNGENGNVEILETPSLFSRTNLKVPAPDLVILDEYLLSCSSCDLVLGRLSPGRLLPLPSSSWKQQTPNWFCCVNKLSTPPPINMQPTDILYGPGTCVFHTDVLAKTQCEGCGDEIGRVVDGTFEAWSSSLTMSRNGTKTLLHSGITSPFTNFSWLLLALTDDRNQTMPQFQFKTGSAECRLDVWVVEKQLQYIRSEVSGELVEEKVIKILFKESSTLSEGFEEVPISAKMLKSGKIYLGQVSQGFPDQAKFVNGYQTSFIAWP